MLCFFINCTIDNSDHLVIIPIKINEDGTFCYIFHGVNFRDALITVFRILKSIHNYLHATAYPTHNKVRSHHMIRFRAQIRVQSQRGCQKTTLTTARFAHQTLHFLTSSLSVVHPSCLCYLVCARPELCSELSSSRSSRGHLRAVIGKRGPPHNTLQRDCDPNRVGSY